MKNSADPFFHPHRRAFLQWLNAGLLASPLLSLSGCDTSHLTDPYPALPPTSDWTMSSKPPQFEMNSDLPWWMKGNYAPIQDELDVENLEVIGRIPPELNGFFLRNGPNPLSTPLFWFFGEGMLHQIHFRDGKAVRYRNRWIETPSYLSDETNFLADQANTSLLYHANRLWTLYEISSPFEVDPYTLNPLGFETFEDQLQTPMCAHPKVDPLTGEVWFIGVNQIPAGLGYGVIDKGGNLIKTGTIDVDRVSLMHDMQLTQNYLVLFDLPMYLDPEIINGGNLFKWEPDAPSRIGLLSRQEGTIQWYDVESGYLFHSFNAYEDGEKVIIEGCRAKPESSEDFFTASASPYFWQWSIDLNTKTVSEGRRDDQLKTDFPMIDLRFQSQKHRYNFGLSLTASSEDYPIHPSGIYTYDRSTESFSSWTLGERLQLDEPYFVPSHSTASEGDGWLLSVAYNRATQKSEVLIFEALNITKGPIARVLLPQRIPFGFHGTWVPHI